MSRLLVYFLCLFCFSGVSQIQWTTYDDQNSPLVDNTIRCLETDNSSNIFVGTDNGLFSFDGTSWTVYDTSNSDIPSNAVRSIFVDDTGNLWLGTFDSGLARLKSGVWTNWSTQNANIPSNFIRDILVDSASRIIVATSYGLGITSDLVTWTSYNVFNSPLWSNNITSLMLDDTTLYFGSINGGLNQLVDTNITVFNSYTSTFPDNTVLDLAFYGGDIWSATPASGLARFIPPSGIQSFSTLNSQLPSNSLTSCYNGVDLYIGSYDYGLIEYNQGQYNYYNTFNSPMPDNYVTCVMEMGLDVWVGTNNGGLVKIANLSPVPGIDKEVVSLNWFDNTLYLQSLQLIDLRICNTQGQQVFHKKVETGEINLSYLTAGLYIVHYTIGNQGWSKKIVVY